MKIIHTADIHIGSSFGGFSSDIRDIRRAELVNSFLRLVEYAKNNQIRNILLAGDIFDKDKVNKSDKDLFYQVIANNKDIDFYYLKGNHDINSAINRDDLENLYTFDSNWKYYKKGNIVIAGIEITDSNKNTLGTTLNLNKDNYNIVLLHTDLKGEILNCLKNKDIDYLALGHIHSYMTNKIDFRCRYVYPGCLEGRGFDEVGEKGFVVLDTSNNTHEFISFASKEIYSIDVDITNTTNIYEALSMISTLMLKLPKKSMARTIIKGKVNYDIGLLEKRLVTNISSHFMYYEVKNEATRIADVSEYLYDSSLRGEVVRTIFSKELPKEQEEEILADFFKLINGEDIDLCD